MKHLVLTVDYEIFGNGTGDVRRHMVEPTERMAHVCERHGVPLTVFFEAEDNLAFARHARGLSRALGYDPARLIREQVADLSRRGHDVQLHLHPQWYGAQYESGQWIINRERETVDHLFETVEETNEYIRERKELLERLVPRNGHPHQVVAYRAGAFSARPGRKLLAALSQNGFRIESSVVKGLQRHDPHFVLDYRDVNGSRGVWRIKEDVGREAADGTLWEVPIHSVMQRRYQQATFRRLRAKFARNVPREQKRDLVQRFANPRHPVAVVKSLWEPVPIKLDFHNLSPTSLMRMIRRAPYSPAQGPVDVMVLIGHSKEHVDDRAFERFLALVAADPGLKVVTFPELAGLLEEHAGGAGGKQTAA